MNKGFFSRRGGKYRQVKHVIDRFPSALTYNIYIEPFCGAGNISFNAPIVHRRMIMSDSDPRVIDIFQGIKDVPADIIKNFDFDRDVHDEHMFDDFLDKFLKVPLTIRADESLTEVLTNEQKLYRNLFLTFKSFAGMGKTFSRSHSSTGKTLKKFIDKYKMILNNFDVVCTDYLTIFESYAKNPDVFWYLDPPYYMQNCSDYYSTTNKTGGIDHLKLFEQICQIRGLFLLSINECPFVRDLYRNYNITSFQSKQANFTSGGIRYTTELLISNY